MNTQRPGMRQHWVDRAYLDAWCDPACPEGHEPFVWVFNFEERTGKKRSPKKLFRESHMYTLPEGDEGDPLALESGLQVLQDDFLRIRSDTLSQGRKLNGEDRALLCIFAAAMLVRTRKHRDHMRDLWGRMVEIAEGLAAEDLPPEKRHTMPISIESPDGVRIIKLSQMKDLAAHPLQRTIMPSVDAVSGMLARMPLRVLCTVSDPGFITSDAPCAVFNAATQNVRAPELHEAGTEVTLPISPTQMAYWGNALNTYEFSYIDPPLDLVDELNRRTRFYCHERFVVKRNVVKEHWYDPGEPPSKKKPAP